MTAAGEPLRLYPTRRQPAPLRPMPEYVAAREVERALTELFDTTRKHLHLCRQALDDVPRLDRDGYLEVGVERLIMHHANASQAMFELTGELAELLARTTDNSELVDEHDEDDEPNDYCTCAHPDCGAC